jgi:foldase protein PrsA
MTTSRVLKTVCAASLVVTCLSGISGCFADQQDPAAQNQIEGLTGGVAATVNGVEIKEDTITIYIQDYRKSSSLSEDDAWGQWLVDSDYTPEKVRQEIIDFYVRQELIKQAAAENNIEIPSTEIDEYVNKMKAYYTSDDAWQQALKSANMTEEEYRSSIELALDEKRIQENVVVPDEPTEDEMLEYAQMYASAYNGAKKSSHILFDTADKAKAQEVLEKLKADELDFAEAAKEYSKDTGSAVKGGDVGWDKTNQFVTEYTEGLSPLEKDQISDLVESQYGFHIIKCTEVFTAPENVTSFDQLPADLIVKDTIKTSLESTKKSEAFTAWYDAYKEAAEIVTNPIPENVPYNIDLSNYKKSTETDSPTGTETPGGTDSSTGTDAGDTTTEDTSGDASTAQPDATTPDATANNGTSG